MIALVCWIVGGSIVAGVVLSRWINRRESRPWLDLDGPEIGADRIDLADAKLCEPALEKERETQE